ncbi:MAG: acyl-CoA synthetase [Pseudomonadales bacterium]|nr:acyl-CoA synthetase [Pseudomonadales bacterium]
MPWNFGDIFEQVGQIMPTDAPALLHGDRRINWGELNQTTTNLAHQLLKRGAKAGDKVTFYMRNCPEYLQTFIAASKVSLVHVNINYRYVDDELTYIVDNSDSTIVVFDTEFSDRIEAIKARLPKVNLWIEVGAHNKESKENKDRKSDHLCFHELSTIQCQDPFPQRSPDDLMFLYTGGTTGLPKGVMWRHDDLCLAVKVGFDGIRKIAQPKDLASHLENIKKYGPGNTILPASPLMHGTGLVAGVFALVLGGSVVTLTKRGFDAEETLFAIERHQVKSLSMVGDAFARPLLKELDNNPHQYDISSLKVITSSGVMYSPDLKQRLLKYNDQLSLIDRLGASEGIGFGASETTATQGTNVAKFIIGENCKVFTENHEEIKPGSGVPGFIARSAPIPIGYYKDAKKTAATFPVIDGVRYSIPGDWCTVEEDGTLTLLGRGSVCINTAGEKVYPEEVEEVLKGFSSVEDALVIGVPDEKWGQSVTGIVQLSEGEELNEEAVRLFVREKLAGYKVPKRIISKKSLERSPNGKADYKGITQFAVDSLSGATA